MHLSEVYHSGAFGGARRDFGQVRIRLGLLLFWLMTISGESEQIATDY
jgi:hypothetical protein